MAGCKRSPSGTPQSDSAQVTIALEASPSTIDPIAVLDVHSQTFATSVHSPLAWVSQEGELKLILAERFTVSADGLSCDIQTKKGASFWDGSPVRAEDVQYSLERFRRSSHPHRWITDRIVGVQEFDKNTNAQHIAGIQIVNQNQLTIRFSSPEPDFTWFMSSLATAVVKEGTGAAPEKPFGSQVIGCGPFRPEVLKLGDMFQVIRNTGFPISNKVTSLRFDVVVDAQERLRLARNAKPVVVRLRGPMLKEACERTQDGRLRPKQEFTGKKVEAARANELTFLILNYGSGALSGLADSERASWHKALSEAMARELMADTLYFGRAGAEPTAVIAPPSTFDTELPNPTSVKGDQTVGPKNITLLNANDAASRQLSAFVQSQCREVGLQLDLETVELPNLIQRIIEKKFEMAGLWVEQQIPASGPIPWISFFDPVAPLSVLGQPINEVTSKLQAARGQLDANARKAGYTEIVRLIDSKQTVWIPLVSRKATFLMSENISVFLDRNGTPVTGLIDLAE